MIDIEKNISFDIYVQNYDINNDRIKLKIEHIKRTAECSRKLATQLNLNDEDIKLAKLIGLLHDIGGFEQLRVYNITQ